MMAWFIGIALALAVAAYARLVGLDRDRAFYPTVLAVIALIYDLFAIVGGSGHALFAEATITLVFFVAVAVGFRTDLRIIVVALAAHGVFDAVHGHVIENPGVPDWWPAFCLAYDVTAALCLAWLLRSRSERHGVAGASS